ncbi:MAG TPA: hypothetical protein PLA43_20235 [Bryobacteraceae bacterium]|nr:hypothetical protein [Bryobacteraceae bacterium]HPU74289.1 hypothetical protein [Bryobacteraceae bacterium]
MALKLRYFSHPDMLRQFEPGILLRIVQTAEGFFASKAFPIPTPNNGDEIDYEALAGILADPDEEMPGDLVDGLHLISELGNEACFDDLLQMAGEAGIPVGEEVTPQDLAAMIWLARPRLLQQKAQESNFERRKTFESFAPADPAMAIDPEKLPQDLSGLEAALREHFRRKKNGRRCRVYRKNMPGSIHFYIQHGQACRREPSVKGEESACTFFRPERTDMVILDTVNPELRINSASAPDMRKYRELFGLHLFGSAETFRYADKYNLEPLRKLGQASLECSDFPALESARLTELEIDWGGTLNNIGVEKADDVFMALEIRQTAIPQEPALKRAKIKVKLKGVKKPRVLSLVAGNKSGYPRGEEAALFEDWLRAREFIVYGKRAYEEAA